MDDISIDRLILDVPGLAGVDAERLAGLVGAGLAARCPYAAAVAGTSFDTLHVNLGPMGVSAGLPQLAEAIVGQLLRQIG